MTQDPPLASDVPQPSTLIELARARLAAELERLPHWESPVLWLRLRAADPRAAMTLGALTHFIRRAAASGNTRARGELFVLLLERTASLNQRWAARVVGRTARLAGSPDARDDLQHDLTLHLWEQVALGSGEKWELFFQRSLDFAQRHVATAYFARRGDQLFVVDGDTPRTVIRALVSLSELALDERADDQEAALAERVDPFSAAELADLRALVPRLPLRERAVIVMRFWQGASEAEMARALGVSARTVRSDARQAYNRLRRWYGILEESDG